MFSLLPQKTIWKMQKSWSLKKAVLWNQLCDTDGCEPEQLKAMNVFMITS